MASPRGSALVLALVLLTLMAHAASARRERVELRQERGRDSASPRRRLAAVDAARGSTFALRTRESSSSRRGRAAPPRRRQLVDASSQVESRNCSGSTYACSVGASGDGCNDSCFLMCTSVGAGALDFPIVSICHFPQYCNDIGYCQI